MRWKEDVPDVHHFDDEDDAIFWARVKRDGPGWAYVVRRFVVDVADGWAESLDEAKARAEVEWARLVRDTPEVRYLEEKRKRG